MKTSNRDQRLAPWRKNLTVAAVAVITLGGVIVVGIWASGGASVLPQRTVKELLSAQTQLNPIQATAELCGDPICVEGWRTDLGSFTRFDSEGAAE